MGFERGGETLGVLCRDVSTKARRGLFVFLAGEDPVMVCEQIERISMRYGMVLCTESKPYVRIIACHCLREQRGLREN